VTRHYGRVKPTGVVRDKACVPSIHLRPAQSSDDCPPGAQVTMMMSSYRAQSTRHLHTTHPPRHSRAHCWLAGWHLHLPSAITEALGG
jgi:hypothetical protein